MLFWLAAMVTLAGSTGFTTIVIPVLVAVVGLTHVAFEVSIQVTICPFVNVDVVNVVPPAPALTPFTCH